MPDERVIDTLQPRPRLWLGSVEFSAFEPRNGKMQRYVQHRAALAYGYAGEYVSGPRPTSVARQWQNQNARILRQPAAERALREQLQGIGFKLATRQSKALPESAGEIFELPSDAAWLRFILNELPGLREQGWEIEYAEAFAFDLTPVERWYATIEEGPEFKGAKGKLDPREIFRTARKMPRYWLAMLRGSAVGVWMGITPGGPTAASFMSYGIARRVSRNRANFGKGEPEGVIAPETADHSAGTAAMLPMLSLGIPGSATSAVMLGGLMIWGLNPGPMLFIEQKDFVWGMIASMYLGNVIGVVLVLATVPLFAAMLSVSFSIIGPIIVTVCLVGAYTVAGAGFDLWLALIFGAMGYVMKKLDYPLAPLVLAMVIGDKAEDAFRQSMLLSNGSLGVLWSNWLVGSLATLAIAILVWPLVGLLLARRSATEVALGPTAPHEGPKP